jgi:hypothetical protein
MWGPKACCHTLPSASLELVGFALTYRQGLKQITFPLKENEMIYLLEGGEPNLTD